MTGLVAAWEAMQAGVEVTLLEADKQAGGKVGSSTVGGVRVDSGPDSFLTRDPVMVDLCHRLGLGNDLVAPNANRAYVWVEGSLCSLPEKSLLGVPYDVDSPALRKILSPTGLDTLRHGLDQLNVSVGGGVSGGGSSTGDVSVGGGVSGGGSSTGDVSVGAALRPLIGDEAFERLVDPLIGGIYAGTADDLSLTACAPSIHMALQHEGILKKSLRWAAQQYKQKQKSGFKSVRGGVFRIVEALVAELGHRVRCESPVLELRPGHTDIRKPEDTDMRAGCTEDKGPRSWQLVTPYDTVSVDAVVLATPAWVTAQLIEKHSPVASTMLSDIDYADVVIVTFELPSERVVHPLNGAGFLVPRNQGFLTTACSWSSSKWQHYRKPQKVILRVSAGRIDDTRWADSDHDQLTEVLIDELIHFGLLAPSGHSSSISFSARITPWPRSLPQYRPGHLDRVGGIRAHLDKDVVGLIVAGAALDGLGLPACARQGINAAIQAIEASQSLAE